MKEENEFHNSKYSKIDNVHITARFTVPPQWENMADELGRDAVKLIYNKWYVPLDNFITKLQSGIDA